MAAVELGQIAARPLRANGNCEGGLIDQQKEALSFKVFGRYTRFPSLSYGQKCLGIVLLSRLILIKLEIK